MFKGTPELIAQRREEIINACEQLYQTMSFKEITLKDIGNATSFSRPTIYNYFESKEEIFLALFEREYIIWTEELESMCSEPSGLNREALAERIAESLENHKLLLKLLAVNLYDMEENSRMERLVSFKTAYGKAREALSKLMQTVYPDASAEELLSFHLTFLMYMHGIYPYAFATEKQKEAMDAVGILRPEMTVRELVRMGLLRMLP